jgi:hypothetical protein
MKKIIITESQLKSVVDRLFSEAETSILNEAATPIEVKVSFNFKSAYPVNSSDPTPFLADFTKTLLEKINATPNGPAMLKSGEMTLSNGTFTAGASNTWLGKVTPYDKENNYLAPPKGQNYEDPLYKKNVDLAMKRAQAFRPSLFNFLKQNKISDSDAAKVAFKTIVLNTGGVKDESRDKTKYPNPGQFMLVSLVFKYKKDMTTETSTGKTSSSSIKTYTDVKPNMILTGSYYTNGKNSLGMVADPDLFVDQRKKLPKEMWDAKHMTAYEIKWNANVVDDPWTRPILRWVFYWNENNKIEKVVRFVYNKKYIPNMNDVPQKEVPLDDPEMLYYFGIRENRPNDGGTNYAKFVKPFI